MKIHIIGGSGTGKTYLAKRLSTEYSVESYDLDDLFWDNCANRYGVKMPAAERDRLLKEILAKDEWIIEGVYYSWLKESFSAADTIILLDIPKAVYIFRIIRRFIRRRLGLEAGKKESFKALLDLLSWTGKFQRENLSEIYSELANYADKTVILHSRGEAEEFAKQKEK